MSQPPLDNQRQQEPRAFAYGRGNQAARRYRSPVPRPPETPPGAVAIPRAGVNRRRFWLLTLLLVLTLGIGAATLSAVFAGQTTPTTAALAPDAGVPAPVRVAPPPTPPTPRPPVRSTAASERAKPAARTQRSDPVGSTPGRAEPTEQPGVSPTPGSTPTGVAYRNCNQAHRAGAAPLRLGDPGYSAKLDKDGDGVACEEKDD